jgi:hypothetical protein
MTLNLRDTVIVNYFIRKSNMKIDHWQIYELEESILASGFPMLVKHDVCKFDAELAELNYAYFDFYANKHTERLTKLADTPIGSGHSNALSGILVAANITATVKWWEQFQRYHFKQIVSSMSTMHRLRKMVLEGTIKFNERTNPDIINAFMQLAKDETVTDEELAYSCPMGIELTARITTNYLQLKTQYAQRCNHKLQEWRDYCAWIESLPLANELIICKKED